MTDLRQRMDEDMIVRGFAARTREIVSGRSVRGLDHTTSGRSPDVITDAEIQATWLYLIP